MDIKKQSGSVFRSQIIVDPQDQHIVDKHSWFISGGYYRNAGKNKKFLHTHILGESDLEVDHIDGNKLNNLRSNLRFVSKTQNQWNRNKNKNNTSGYKGVMKQTNSNLYIAKIGVNNSRIFLGTFNTAEKAALAYNKAALEYHGKFAKLNEVSSGY